MLSPITLGRGDAEHMAGGLGTGPAPHKVARKKKRGRAWHPKILVKAKPQRPDFHQSCHLQAPTPRPWRFLLSDVGTFVPFFCTLCLPIGKETRLSKLP